MLSLFLSLLRDHLSSTLLLFDSVVDTQHNTRAQATEEDAHRRRVAHADQQLQRQWQQVADAGSDTSAPPSFPEMKSFEQKNILIQEWQEQMPPCRFVESACAVCVWSVPSVELATIQPTCSILQLLRNDCLPLYVMPTSHDTNVYCRAILCPKGLTSHHILSPIRTCVCCQNALQARPPRQPKFALTNFLCYGFERPPHDVRHAFETASPFDLLLISRCRSSTITHQFVRRGRRGGYVPEECSQRFNRGNIAIIPQDPDPLCDVLPLINDCEKDSTTNSLRAQVPNHSNDE